VNQVEIKNRVTTRGAAWANGSGKMSAPGSDMGAGGGAIKLPFSSRSVAQDGAVRNRNRLPKGTTAVHHNGGTASIGVGSTGPSR
jgi:hypothetical protein